MAKILSWIKLLMFISWCSDWNCGIDQKVHLHILLLPYLSLSWLLYWRTLESLLSLIYFFLELWWEEFLCLFSALSSIRRTLLPGLCKKLTGPNTLKLKCLLFRCWLLFFFKHCQGKTGAFYVTWACSFIIILLLILSLLTTKLLYLKLFSVCNYFCNVVD